MQESELLTVSVLLWIVVGYLSGSIPFGLLIARAGGKGDVRTIGSGNIGATNVLRTGSKTLAGLTLLADILKGFVPAALALHWFGMAEASVAGAGAVAGHLFPVWLRFKGGKGVATYLGVLLAIAWLGALVFGAVWLTIAAIFRFSSLAALVAVTAVPIALYLLGAEKPAGVFALLGLAIILMHHANIARLIKGTETRIGARD